MKIKLFNDLKNEFSYGIDVALRWVGNSLYIRVAAIV